MQAPNPVGWALGATLLLTGILLAATLGPLSPAVPVVVFVAGIAVLATAYGTAGAAPVPRLILERIVSPGMVTPAAVSRNAPPRERVILTALGRRRMEARAFGGMPVASAVYEFSTVAAPMGADMASPLVAAPNPVAAAGTPRSLESQVDEALQRRTQTVRTPPRTARPALHRGVRPMQGSLRPTRPSRPSRTGRQAHRPRTQGGIGARPKSGARTTARPVSRSRATSGRTSRTG